MITNGESQIAKVVAICDGKVSSPCGACREYMIQLDKNSGDIEILLDFETRKTILYCSNDDIIIRKGVQLCVI